MASISDRKGVDRRRTRGALLGIRTGNQMLHPAWQFDHRRQDTLPGLPLVLAALSEVAADGLDADAVDDWWAATPPPIVYRTRSVPAARSIAFTRSVTWTHGTAGHLPDATALLVTLVTHHGSDVPQTWLERPYVHDAFDRLDR